MKTKFNPENKEVLTYGECLDPAMKITDKENADQYFNDYVKYTQKFLDEEPREDNKTAADIARINLGYYAGYYGHDVQKRVEKLFLTAHPIFGSVKEEPPSFKEAFECGKQGKTLKQLRNDEN